MEAEETFIRGIRLSATKQYMVVLWKDHPFQLWELKTGSLLRTVTFSQITALEWSPNPIILPAVGANPASIREQFVFSTPDGALHYYAVENNQLTPIQMHVDVGIGIVSSLAWKDNLLVSGGTTGSIQCYNMEKKKLQYVGGYQFK
jgi:WD40 repeat protein